MNMRNDTSHFVVSLTEDNFSSKAKRGYITGTGHMANDVAYSLGMSTFEDIELSNDNYILEQVTRTIDAYDWDAYMRKQLDNEPECIALASTQDEYLPGDNYDINHHDSFVADVTKCRKAATESILEVFPFNPDAEAPKDLLERIEKAVNSVHDCIHDEWLNGRDGVKAGIARHFGISFNSVYASWEKVTLDFTEEEAREWLGYNIQDDEPITAELLTRSVTYYLLSKVEERISLATKRSQERLKVYEECQKADKEALEAKKRAARERKNLAQK